VQSFGNTREAKEFLIGKIVAEAQREGVRLSEVERKMLYFSEAAWTLPDMMEVNDAFCREYDQAEYEDKIAKLIRNLRATVGADKGEREAWTEAARTLAREDHYLLVMISQAGATGRPRGDVLKLWATAVVITCVITAVISWASRR
jgi:hypothetical protein